MSTHYRKMVENNDNPLPDRDEQNLMPLVEGSSINMVAEVFCKFPYSMLKSLHKDEYVLKVRDGIFNFYHLTKIPLFHACMPQPLSPYHQDLLWHLISLPQDCKSAFSLQPAG